MPESRDPRYEETRRRFDELDVEHKTRFLVEATASTLARGVQHVGELLADGLEDVFRRARRGSASSAHRPGAAEPETAQRRQPRSGARESDRSS